MERISDKLSIGEKFGDKKVWYIGEINIPHIFT